MEPQSASSQEVTGLQGLVQGGMASVAKPATPAQEPLSNDAASLQTFLDSSEPAVPLPTKRPSSSEDFNAAQYAGGYSEAAEKSGRPVTYLMQKPDESYSDFMKRAVEHGKTVTQEQVSDEADQPKKLALGVPKQVAATTTASFGSLAAAAEAINAGGPAARKGLEWVANWAKNNKSAAGLGLLWAINQGLEAAGLPKASRIVEKLELPAILLLGGKGAAAEEEAGAATAAEETSAAETSARRPAVPTASAQPAAAKESPEEFVNRQTAGRAQVKPNAEGQTVNATSGEPIAPEEGVDLRTAEEKQASVDKYYEAHPEKRPQPKVIQRGPKKGQVKMVRVFDEGKWHEVPVYK